MFCTIVCVGTFYLVFGNFLSTCKERLIFVPSSDGVFHFIFLMLGIDEKYSLLQGNYLPCSPHSLSFKTSLKPGREENHLLNQQCNVD